MPSGTYHPGRKARIEVDEAANQVSFYDNNSDEFLEIHRLAEEGVVGQCIRHSNQNRDRKTKHAELIDKVREGFGRHELTDEFITRIIKDKPRYSRDHMSLIVRQQKKYTKDELLNAVSYCVERELFSANDLGDVLEYFAVPQEEAISPVIKLPLKYSIVTAEKRPLDTYASLSDVRGA
jgi:hypothetical protein